MPNLGSLALFIALLILGNPAKAMTISAEGEVNGDFESLTLDITVSRLEAGVDVASADLNDTDLAAGYIDIFLPKDDSTKPIYRGSSNPDDTSGYSDKFYWELVSARLETDGTDTLKAVYQLKVYSNASATDPVTLESIRISDSRSAVTVRVRFNPSSDGTTFDQSSTGTDFEIERLLAKPNEAPADFAATGVFRGILANWTVKDSVPYTNASINRKPSQVVVFTFSSGATNVQLAAKSVDGEGNETDTTCSYNGASSCITCPTGNVFVSSEQTTSAQGLVNVQVSSNDGSTRISNLDPESDFVVAAQYKDGVQRTTCLTVTPSENITLTELHGDKSFLGDPRCFVATAAYGSPFTEELRTFRWFRTHLRHYEWGKRLVNAYYRHSPPFAQWIADSETRRTIARGVLSVPATILGWLRKDADQLLFLLLMGSTLLALSILGFLFVRLAIVQGREGKVTSR